GTWNAVCATASAATSPRTSGAIRLAVLTALRHAASAGLLGRRAIPYIPAKTMRITSAAPAERRRQRPILCRNPRGSVMGVLLGFGSSGFSSLDLGADVMRTSL